MRWLVVLLLLIVVQSRTPSSESRVPGPESRVPGPESRIPNPESIGAQPPRELRWAADPEGGAPYVEADPADPSRVQGFEVEIADLVARALGRTPRFMLVGYAS